MTVRLAVFDCDGTLIDSQIAICEAMETAFAQNHLAAPARNDIRRAVGLSLPQAVQRLIPEADAALRANLVNDYKLAFRDARAAGRLVQTPFDGMIDVLDRLRAAGWQLAVATGMSDRGLIHCLAVNDISDRFVSLQTADRHPSKPHPAMLEAALSDTGAQPCDCVMIGDTAFDMEMGRSIGVRAIGVDWGYHEAAELIAAGAEFVAETPNDLAEYLIR